MRQCLDFPAEPEQVVNHGYEQLQRLVKSTLARAKNSTLPARGSDRLITVDTLCSIENRFEVFPDQYMMQHQLLNQHFKQGLMLLKQRDDKRILLG